MQNNFVTSLLGDYDAEERERLRQERKAKVEARLKAKAEERLIAGETTAETPNPKILHTDSKSTDSLGRKLSAKTAVFGEGEWADRLNLEDAWQNKVKKDTGIIGSDKKSGVPDNTGKVIFGDRESTYDEYDKLWMEWFEQNPDVYAEAKAKRLEGYEFLDRYGKAGDARQDETIMRLIDSGWEPETTEVKSIIVQSGGTVRAMRATSTKPGHLPNPFYYQGGGSVDAIVKISEGSEEANIKKVVELHKNWLETGAVPDGLSDEDVKKLADMREKQLIIIDNLPDNYTLEYYRPNAPVSHAITLENFIEERRKGGRAKIPTGPGTPSIDDPAFISQAANEAELPRNALKEMLFKHGIKVLPALNIFRTLGVVDEAIELVADKLLKNVPGFKNTSIGKSIANKGIGLMWVKAELANLFAHHQVAADTSTAILDAQMGNLIWANLTDTEIEDLPEDTQELLAQDIGEVYREAFAPGKTSAFEQIDLYTLDKTGKRQVDWAIHAGKYGYNWIRNLFMDKAEPERFKTSYGWLDYGR